MPEGAPPPKLIISGGDDWKKRDEPAAKPAASAAAGSGPAQPSLAVDADWKAQAQAEKDKMAAAAEAKAAKGGGKPSGGAGAGSREMPVADFSTLLETLVTQALLYMGAFPDPQTGRAVVSLEYAKFHIDLLAVLQEKTKGNLSEEESKAVSETLYALQMQFVEVSKAVAQMIAERRAGGGQAGGAGLGGLSGPGLGPSGGGAGPRLI